MGNASCVVHMSTGLRLREHLAWGAVVQHLVWALVIVEHEPRDTATCLGFYRRRNEKDLHRRLGPILARYQLDYSSIAKETAGSVVGGEFRSTCFAGSCDERLKGRIVKKSKPAQNRGLSGGRVASGAVLRYPP
jgi:hypothetical protein